MMLSIGLPSLAISIAFASSAMSAPASIVALRAVSGCAGWSHVAALSMDGTHEGDGLVGPFHQSIDARRGRSAIVVHEGRFVAAEGFDGERAWSQDFSGGAHVRDASHAREVARTDAWLDRRGWCRDGDRTAYRNDGTRTRDRRSFDVVSVTPHGGSPVTIWIDRTSHLIDRTYQRLNENSEVTSYADWRAVGDVAIPFARRIDDPEDDDSETYTVRNVAVVPPLPNRAFAMPTLPHDFRILGGARTTRVPYTVEGLKPIVDVMLDGRGPFPFVLDTGAHFILTPATARRLGLGGIGSARETGQGTGIRTTQFASVRELRIGDAVIANQVAELIPYSFRRLERGPRPPKAGWLGLQFFERFATTFDPVKHTISLARLDRPHPTAGGVRVPIVFDEDAPLVPCTVDRRSGSCMIDTGNAGSTIVEGHWIATHALEATLQRRSVTIDDISLGRADLTIGSIRAPHESIEFAKAASRGSESTTVEAAILSEGLLDRFVMTVDYGRGAAWFDPVPGAHQPPIDRAGIEVDKERNGNFTVWLVLPRSPASHADIRIGDRIVAVDGISSRQLSGTAFHAIAQGVIGSRHVYRIVRSGRGTISVKVRLREFLP